MVFSGESPGISDNFNTPPSSPPPIPKALTWQAFEIKGKESFRTKGPLMLKEILSGKGLHHRLSTAAGFCVAVDRAKFPPAKLSLSNQTTWTCLRPQHTLGMSVSPIGWALESHGALQSSRSFFAAALLPEPHPSPTEQTDMNTRGLNTFHRCVTFSPRSAFSFARRPRKCHRGSGNKRGLEKEISLSRGFFMFSVNVLELNYQKRLLHQC